MTQLIDNNATTAHNPDEYDRKYAHLEDRHHQLALEHTRISQQIENLRQRRAQAATARDYLASQPPLEYSDHAWNILIDHATINTDGRIDLHIKN